MTETRPYGFWIYLSALSALVTGALAVRLSAHPDLTRHAWAFVLLTILLAVAEHSDLSYYEGDVRWGLSPAEAVLVPMLIVLSPTQVLIGAVVAMASIFKEWRDPAKQAFNVAQFGSAAILATSVFSLLQDPSTAFSAQDAAAAVCAAVVFTLATHVLVGVAIQLAQQGRVLDGFGGVRWTMFTNLVGSVVLGLFAAAAFTSAPWLLALFPFALAGLYFGYRAVARQSAERMRVERLHEATRSLATSSDLPNALEGFLSAVSDVLSAIGSRAVISTRTGLVSSSVYAGDEVERMQNVNGSGMESFLHYVRETRRPLLFGPDHDPVPEAFRPGGARNVLAVPVLEDDEVTGLLIASDRVGADDFGPDDVKLLEALAGDLSLTLQSARLFEEINEERERFQLLVESVSDYAIYMLDPHGKVVSWNSGAERILGYSSDVIMGRHHSTFYPPEAQGTAQEELNQASMSGRSESEGHRVRQDGSLFMANEIITPVRAGDGRLTGFAKVTRDISERVRTEAEKEALQAQLHQAQKLETVGQLAGGVAHDFNNLLSVITNATSFAISALPKGHDVQEDLRDVKSATKRATDLTRQLLIFSRRDLYKPQPINLNEVIRQALKLLTRALGERVVVQANLDESIGTIEADPGQLEQVLMNLAINARDAMPGGGTVTIETAQVTIDDGSISQYIDLSPGPHIRMTVSDTGTGMNPAVAQKAFDPFFTTKPKGSGTGLGLATVYGIVKGAHGHINVMSSEGLGTTFEILLPVTTATVSPKGEVMPDVQPMQRANRGEMIFLVEDDDAVRSVTQRLLEREGYTVTAAPGSKQALSMFPSLKDSVTLLLTDIVMPEMTGVELVQRVRQMKPDQKVLYMSGYSAGVFSSGGAELEGELIQKPFDREELLDAIRRALDSSSEVN